MLASLEIRYSVGVATPHLQMNNIVKSSLHIYKAPLLPYVLHLTCSECTGNPWQCVMDSLILTLEVLS